MNYLTLPAVPYINLVRQYAKANGIKCFTWAELKIAIQLYEARAERDN
jgi:hypothetical protein